jgi:AcrR family transcriptional regulator
MAHRSPVSVPSVSGGPRRREILAIGTGLFAENGYHGTSIRDIAEACHLQPASLYSHFQNKEEVLLGILSGYVAALVPALEGAAGGDGDGRARLARVFDTAVSVGYRHRAQFIILSNDWSHIRRTPGLRSIVEDTRRCEAVWRRVLRDGVADGSLRSDITPAQTLRVLFGAVSGLVDNRYDDLGSGRPRGRPGTSSVLLDGVAAP